MRDGQIRLWEVMSKRSRHSTLERDFVARLLVGRLHSILTGRAFKYSNELVSMR